MYLPGGAPTAHVDRFAARNLPSTTLWPVMDYSTLPELRTYPARMNAGAILLDDMVKAGFGQHPCIHFDHRMLTYAALLDMANRVARVLTEDYGLQPGNRVLLRAPNNAMLVASWFGVLKAGGICVTTMPLLRARELTTLIEKAEITHALCDVRLAGELETARARAPHLARIGYFTATGEAGDDGADLDARMARKPVGFANVATAADDVALIAFTSGTTGAPKGTMHCHRDVLAICDCFPRSTFKATSRDVVCGSPPLAFTFGLGALTLFPMRFGAAAVLLEQFSPEILLQTIQDYRVTACYTAPTGYRAMADMVGRFDLSSLTKSVSAGEHLPKPTAELWRDATGIKIIDGLGATELLHIFVSASDDDVRPGATGRVIPGYEAMIVGADGEPLPDGEPGRLAIRGPTGCRYLADPERQQVYVQNGWNLTGDVYIRDAEGYFWYQARSDDMIISAGYNIAGPEVESVLLDHPKVRECAVVASPDAQRGHIVKAFIVLREAEEAHDDTVKLLQDFVKAEIAPYKYPRAIEFVMALPRTETGKLQRFRLREQEEAAGATRPTGG